MNDLWSRASKPHSHKGADIELDALTNRKPVKEVSDEGRDMGELWDAPYEMDSCIENRLKLNWISWRKTYVDRITIINPGAGQSMNQTRYGMQRERLADETE